MSALTPIDRFEDFWAKREDRAFWTSLDYPSGSKVRQFAAMAKPSVPMVVGCAADSAMQIYVAAAARQGAVPGIVFVPASKTPSEATAYALAMGAEVHAVRPGYMSVLRARAREHAKQFPAIVKWSVSGAIADAAEQVANLPPEAARVLVPTGSGLTAAGILIGLAARGRALPVRALAVSTLAEEAAILGLAYKFGASIHALPPFSLVRHPWKYAAPAVRALPDGTPLDPFYAAKALDYVQPGDVLWVPGLRPVCAMPSACRRAFAAWQGFPP